MEAQENLTSSLSFTFFDPSDFQDSAFPAENGLSLLKLPNTVTKDPFLFQGCCTLRLSNTVG